MTNFFVSLITVFTLLSFVSCASNSPEGTVSITTAQNGVFTGEQLSFPLYITDKNISKDDVKKEMGNDVLFVYQGPILDAKKTKEENLKSLALIKLNQYDLVNLNLEDLLVAKTQDINLDTTGLNFINTSIEDIKLDKTYRSKKVAPFALYKDVIILGLSGPKLSPDFINADVINEYHVGDYALSILKTRKEISLLTAPNPKKKNKKEQLKIQSFIIIHDLGSDINDVTSRLPPYFMDY